MPDTAETPLLLNPKTRDYAELDPASRRILRATIDFFEDKGKAWLKQQARDRVWYTDFLDMIKKERVFAHLAPPRHTTTATRTSAGTPGGSASSTEILGFYGAAVLVHLAGLGARAGTIFHERQRGGQAARGRARWRTAGIFAFGSPNAHTAPTSTRPTCCCHRTATAAMSRTAASTTSATATTRRSSRCSASAPTRGSGRLRLLRRRPPAPAHTSW